MGVGTERRLQELWRDLPIYLAMAIICLTQLGLAGYLEHKVETTDIGLGAIIIMLPLLSLMFAPAILAMMVLVLSLPQFKKQCLWLGCLLFAALCSSMVVWREDLLFWYFQETMGLEFIAVVLVAAGLRCCGFSLRSAAHYKQHSIFHIQITDLLWWMVVAAIISLAWQHRNSHPVGPRYNVIDPMICRTPIILWVGIRRTNWFPAVVDIFGSSLLLSLAYAWLTVGRHEFSDFAIFAGWSVQATLILGLRFAGYRILRGDDQTTIALQQE
jgi:hypothetical protein